MICVFFLLFVGFLYPSLFPIVVLLILKYLTPFATAALEGVLRLLLLFFWSCLYSSPLLLSTEFSKV